MCLKLSMTLKELLLLPNQRSTQKSELLYSVKFDSIFLLIYNLYNYYQCNITSP